MSLVLETLTPLEQERFPVIPATGMMDTPANRFPSFARSLFNSVSCGACTCEVSVFSRHVQLPLTSCSLPQVEPLLSVIPVPYNNWRTGILTAGLRVTIHHSTSLVQVVESRSMWPTGVEHQRLAPSTTPLAISTILVPITMAGNLMQSSASSRFPSRHTSTQVGGWTCTTPRTPARPGSMLVRTWT